MISKVSKVEVGFLSRFDFDDYILDYISFPFPENTNVLNEEVGLSGKSVWKKDSDLLENVFYEMEKCNLLDEQKESH